MSEKKIIIAVGGTGGHIYPALAVASKLTKLEPRISILFVGGGLSRNRYFNKSAFPYREISCGTLSLRRPLASFIKLGHIAKGIQQGYRLLKEVSPSLVLGFGSYYTLPLLLSAKWAEIPIILHEQNSIPGRVNRLFSKQALFTGVHFLEAKKFLKGKTVEVGMPLREDLCLGSQSRESARKFFGLNNEKPVVLVFGGSQGAHAINQLFYQGFEEVALHEFQVLHFTGDPEFTRKLKQRYQSCGVQACVKDYETQMELAWQAADVVVSRSGAGTIAEQVEFQVPGILIPYPYAMDNHQEKNADFMVQEIGGAIKLLERDLTPNSLLERVRATLDEDRLMRMRESIESYKNGNPTVDFSSVILDYLNTGLKVKS